MLTALATAVLAPLAVATMAAALHTPRDPAGRPVPRSRRTWGGDVRSVLGLS